ncbi:MAG: NAD(P)H-dependent glycerol-3-phosphate dehydrogenase [Thermonemataceae bacterium]
MAVIGGGSWATALIKILCVGEVKIRWWLRNEQDVQHIQQYHHNPNYLSDIEIHPEQVAATHDIRWAMEEATYVILVVPAAFIQEPLRQLTPEDFQGKIVISAVKGMIPERNLLVTDQIEADFEVANKHLAIIAGPCHAEEVALERQSYLTIASNDLDTAAQFAALLSCRYIKATPFDDLLGIEYCAVMKNVVALACGIAHGLGFGDNFQAVMVTNALLEIERFIDAIYPLHRNLTNTAYLGDLLVTAYSQFSRNRTFGNMIGRGYTVSSAQVEMNMIAEGYYAVKSIQAINEQYQVDMPITQATYRILYKKSSPVKEFDRLKRSFV